MLNRFSASPLPLLLGVLLASASTRLAPWGLALLALLALTRRATGGRPSPTPLDWPVGLLLLMLPASLLVTPNLAATSLAASRLLAGVALTYGLARWLRGDAGRFAALALALAGCGALLACLAPWTMRWPSGPINPTLKAWSRRFPCLLADPLNSNMVAGSLVMFLPFPLVLWQEPALSTGVARQIRQLARRALALLALAALLLALWLTQSRGGWIAAAVALFVYFALRLPWLWGGVPLVALVAGLLDALPSAWVGGAVQGWEERVEIWGRALAMIRDHPLTGVGAGTYYDWVTARYPLPALARERVIPHAHNLLLEVALGLGLPGLVAFLALVIVVFVIGLTRVREGRGFEAALSRAALASLVGMLAHGLVDATTWINGWGAPLPWAVFGLLLALEPASALPNSTAANELAMGAE